jgi:membrane-associated PAP2 superfamily phosphatase
MNFVAHLRRILLCLAVPLLVILAWDVTPADLVIAQWYGTPSGFPLRDHFWLARVLHDWPQRVGLLLILVCVVAVWHPRSIWGRTTQRERVWLAALVIFCALLIPALKMQSYTSCPWELNQFGGSAQYVWHFTFTNHDGGGAHCFPSGHASAFFSFLPAFWLVHRHKPRLAWLALAGWCVFGLAMSWGQVMRGAHYPSHLLWTMWLCWALGTLASPLLGPQHGDK